MERKKKFSIMRILFFFLFSSFAFSQSFITELADKTVGKFLYDKNIEIKTDTLDIYIRVNDIGFCYALDVLTTDKTKTNLGYKSLKKIIGNDLDWVDNDSIVEKSLDFDEYQTCVDYLSYRGRNSRYYHYLEHAQAENMIYILLRSANTYAILVEPVKTEFLTYNEEETHYQNSIAEEIITFNSLDEAYLFLNSDEVNNKGIELKKVQDEIIKSENEMRAIPISSIELPYKMQIGITEAEADKNIMMLFGNYVKDIEDPEYQESFKKGIYKEVSYLIKDGISSLRIYIKFFHNKVFHIGYSHFVNDYSSPNEELNTQIFDKLELIANNYYLLFEINSYSPQESFNNSVWSMEEKLKFEEENEELLNSIQEARTKKENSIGRKM